MKLKNTFAIVLSSILLLAACVKQEKEQPSNGEATVSIRLLGAEDQEENDDDGNASSARSVTVSEVEDDVQTQIVPFGDDMNFVATLSKERSSDMRNSATGSSRNRAATVLTPLGQDVRYRVLVYDGSGAFVEEKDYQVGKESSVEGFNLDAGKSYTFIAYSVNGTTALPNPSDKANLSTARLNNIAGPLLYFRKDVELVYGENTLDLTLKHQYSQITTRIELDQSTAGNITAVDNPTIRPVRQDGSITFSDGVVTYGSAASNGAEVVFPSLGGGVRSITSSPTLLISPSTTTAEFNVGTLTANNITKADVVINNLKITPGTRYNLVMKLQSPCTEVVSGGATFDLADGNSQTFTAPAADYGFTFDIHRLDNSFNLEINNTLLAVQELQFQTGVADLSRNVEFADGTVWGSEGISEIYNMNGNASNPILRVIISASGDISLLGSKSSSGGNLEPLRLTNGNQFNSITWNRNSDNTVIATQSVEGVTYMTGNGYGRRIVPCN
ncbi:MULTISPECIES: fimbrillin family protein [Sphingobacterium]|uniref:Fimbrillin family protein n=1 Tax=Sphingobacterium populi TaxID=1812824 RepID=A0ABW5UAE0_9SPHI|nr:fimbrillin family protein [Sphingobacterium sp. CFCC 11742]